jgi:hypothetical protein
LACSSGCSTRTEAELLEHFTELRSIEGAASDGTREEAAQQRGVTNPVTVTRWFAWAVAWAAGIANDSARAEAQQASPQSTSRQESPFLMPHGLRLRW